MGKDQPSPNQTDHPRGRPTSAPTPPAPLEAPGDRLARLRTQAATLGPEVGRSGGDTQRRRQARRADPKPNPTRGRTAVARTQLATTREIGLDPLETTAITGLTINPAADSHTQPHPTALTNPPPSNRTAASQTLTQVAPPLIFSKEPRDNIVINTIFQLYLRGYTREAIAVKVQINHHRIRTILKQIKGSVNTYMRENPQIFGTPLEALYLQVLRRRERQSAVWEEIEVAPHTTKPALFRILGDEDKSIESLLGLDHSVLKVVTGSPAEHARANLIEQLGPEGLKTLLQDIRQTHSQLTGSTDIDLKDENVIDQAPQIAMDGGAAEEARLERRRKRRRGLTAGPR